MLSFRKRILTALVLSLAVALPTFAADAPAGSLEKYLPDGADGVISINVRQLLDSELIKKAGLDKMLAGEEVQKAMKTVGLDPLKDVDRLVISGGKDDQTVVIIQGKFDPAKLSAAIEGHAKDQKEALKIHKTEHGKVYELTKLDEIIQLPPQAAGAGIDLKGKSVFAVIADKGNVVISQSKEGADAVLAKAAGKKTTKLASKELPGLLAKINAKQSVAVAFPAPAGEEKIKSITGGITVTGDVKIDFNVAAADADAAKTLNGQIAEQLKMVQDIVGIIVLQEKALAPVVDVVNAIKHDAKDSNIGITGDIKGDTLEKLVKGLVELAAKTGGIK